jgi:hypothetical protein
MVVRIRTSDRRQFRICRSAWDFGSPIRKGYSLLPNWPQTSKQKNLDFGSAIHEGLATFYDPQIWTDWEVRTLAAEGAFRIEIERQEQAALIFVPQGSDQEDECHEEFKSRMDLGVGMLLNYFEYARVNDKGKPLLVETKFSVPIPGFRDVLYEGKVDVVWEDEDGLWIWDHKTTASFGDMPYLGPPELDSQVRSYCWAIRKALQVPIRGFVINELRKSWPAPPQVLKSGQLSKNKQQDCTYEGYLAALKERNLSTQGYEDFLEFLKGRSSDLVRRSPVFFSETDLTITEDLIVNEVFDMLGSFNGTPTYSLPSIYPNPSKALCQGCEFRQPCIERFTGGDYMFLLNDKQRYRKEDDDAKRPGGKPGGADPDDEDVGRAPDRTSF